MKENDYAQSQSPQHLWGLRFKVSAAAKNGNRWQDFYT
jgi:hypothetical protein